MLQSEINELIDGNAGTDKLWNFDFKNTKDLGKKYITEHKILERLGKDKLIIIKPAVEDYGTPEEKFEITISNILTISLYQEPECISFVSK